MPRTVQVSALAFLLAALTACGKEPNLADYTTDEIEAVFKAQNLDSGNEGAFEVILLGPSTNGSPNYIKLPEEAVLTATWGDESVVLEQVTQGVITYGAGFTTTEQTEFNIAFTRPDGEDALVNTLFLAAPFEITEVSGSVGPEGSLDVAWSGGSGVAELYISGDCVQAYSASVDMAEGSVAVPFESFTPVDTESPTSCSLSTQLNSTSEGLADPAWSAQSATVSRVLRSQDNATSYQP